MYSNILYVDQMRQYHDRGRKRERERKKKKAGGGRGTKVTVHRPGITKKFGKS